MDVEGLLGEFNSGFGPSRVPVTSGEMPSGNVTHSPGHTTQGMRDAYTTIDWTINCNCSCSNDVWKLDDCDVFFNIIILIRAGLPVCDDDPDWYMKKEKEHAQDILDWIPIGEAAAAAQVKLLQKLEFATQSGCELFSQMSVGAAISASFRGASAQSKKNRHKNNAHTCGGAQTVSNSELTESNIGTRTDSGGMTFGGGH